MRFADLFDSKPEPLKAGSRKIYLSESAAGNRSCIGLSRNTVDRLQNDPQSLDGGLGYAAGHYLGMAWPNGAIDFKNRFRGQGDPTDLGRAGNFAYYAIGSGILPDAVLDAGASAYNFYKTSKDLIAKQDGSAAKMKQNSIAIFSPDASAQSVRDHALAYGARLK